MNPEIPPQNDEELLKDYEAQKMHDEWKQEAMPEVPKPEQPAETIPEKNKKIIENFDVETKSREAQAEGIAKQIRQREYQKPTNIELGQSSVNEDIDKDIRSLQEQGAQLSIDIEKRKPDETEQLIAGQIIGIDKRIENIMLVEKQDSPSGVPFSVTEGRRRDIAGLEKQKQKLLEEADIAKVEKINKYYAETKSGEQKIEGAPEFKSAEHEKEAEPISAGTAKPERPKSEEEKKLWLQKELVTTFSAFAEKVKFQEDSGEISIADKKGAQILYEKSGGLVQTLIGENFDRKVADEAKKQAESEGHKIKTKAEYFSPERASEMRKKEQLIAWSAGIHIAWDKLSPEEKAKWNAESLKNEKLKNKPDGGIRQFGIQLDKDRSALEKKGFVFSRDVYFRLINEGYDPRTIREKGWFKKRMEIQKNGKYELFTEEQEKNIQKEFDERIGKQVVDKMAAEYTAGNNRWLKRKLIKAGDIVVDVTKDYQATLSPDIGPIKPVSERVKIETLTFEQQDQMAAQEIEKLYQEKFEKLKGEGEWLVGKLNLNEKQKTALDLYINSGKRDRESIDFIPKDLLQAVEEMANKKAEIEKRRNDSLGAIDSKRIIRIRDELSARLEKLKTN